MILNADCTEAMREMAADSIDAIVTDPPYGLADYKPDEVAAMLAAWLAGEPYRKGGRGFMGKGWDSCVPGPDVWREALRVLKPGGHLVAFAGARTVDLMGLAIRLGGFEVRDGLQWLYGSGFPKSLNVSKALDALQAKGDPRELLPGERRFCDWMREHSGLTEDDARRLLGSARFVTGEVEIVNTATVERPRMGRRAMVPTAEAWERLLPHLATQPPAWVAALVKNPPQPGIDHPGEWNSGAGEGTTGTNDWAGWGTALKPAHEPIILARKPLIGTVASNVLEHGAGALNVDGCRIGAAGGTFKASKPRGESHGIYGEGINGTVEIGALDAGRWPANVLLDAGAAAYLDAQAGERGGGFGVRGGQRAELLGGLGGSGEAVGYGDRGGPSRFFLTVENDRENLGETLRFFYAPKAATSEREAGLDGFDAERRSDGRTTDIENPRLRTSARRNDHPTVKPIALMRWLVRLVTPPGGVVLDPFAGSGTTLIAAGLEGFRATGIEMDAHYCEIAHARIAHWANEGTAAA